MNIDVVVLLLASLVCTARFRRVRMISAKLEANLCPEALEALQKGDADLPANSQTVAPTRSRLAADKMQSNESVALTTSIMGLNLAAAAFQPVSAGRAREQWLLHAVSSSRNGAGHRSAPSVKMMARFRSVQSRGSQTKGVELTAKQLTARIKQASSDIDELLRLHQQHAVVFDSLHLVQFWTHIGKLAHRQPKWLQKNAEHSGLLQRAIVDLIKACDMRSISTVAHGLAKAGILSEGAWSSTWTRIAETAMEHISDSDVKGLPITAWAFAKAGHKAPQLFAAIASASVGLLCQFSPQGIANLAWAFATIDHEAHELFQALAKETTVRVHDFKLQEVTNIAWACATAKHVSQDLFTTIADVVTKRVSEMTPQGIANTAWAFAAAEHQAPELFAAIARVVVQHVQDFSLQGISTIAWAFSRAAHESPELFASLAREAAARTEKFNKEDVVLMVMAFGSVEYSTNGAAGSNLKSPAEVMDLFSKIRREVLAQIDSFTGKHLYIIYRAYATLGLMDDDLRNQIAGVFSHIGKSLDEASNAESEGVFGDEVQKSRPRLPTMISETSEPFILSEGRHWMALYKPPFWMLSMSSQDEAVIEDAPVGWSVLEWAHQNWGSEYPICDDPEMSYGLLHRLDQETSGVLMCAKSYLGSHLLRLQWCDYTIDKEYICLVHGHVDPSIREITTPILIEEKRRSGKDPNGEPSQHCRVDPSGKPAHSRIVTLAHLVAQGDDTKQYSLVSVKILTGRTHQIRVHLSSLGHRVVSDVKYNSDNYIADRAWCKRMFLHQYRIGFDDVPKDAVGASERIHVTCPLPEGLCNALGTLSPVDERSTTMYKAWKSGIKRRVGEFDKYVQEVDGGETTGALDLQPTVVKSSAVTHELLEDSVSGTLAAATVERHVHEDPGFLETLKVAELKERLKAKGMRVSGTKSQLIERLSGNDLGHASCGDVLVQFTLAELKARCREKGLPVSGSKAVLLEKLKQVA